MFYILGLLYWYAVSFIFLFQVQCCIASSNYLSCLFNHSSVYPFLYTSVYINTYMTRTAPKISIFFIRAGVEVNIFLQFTFFFRKTNKYPPFKKLPFSTSKQVNVSHSFDYKQGSYLLAPGSLARIQRKRCISSSNLDF